MNQVRNRTKKSYSTANKLATTTTITTTITTFKQTTKTKPKRICIFFAGGTPLVPDTPKRPTTYEAKKSYSISNSASTPQSTNATTGSSNGPQEQFLKVRQLALLHNTPSFYHRLPLSIN